MRVARKGVTLESAWKVLTRSSSRLLRTAIIIPVVCLHLADRQDETGFEPRERDALLLMDRLWW